MGSLATHFSAFLFLFPIGLRRLLCCFSLYLKSPHTYKSKPWYLSDPKWKTIDIYILLIALPIASFSDIFLFLSFSGHPIYRFSFFQESFVILMFWVLMILIIIRENIDSFLINENFLFIFASICFLLEFFIIGKEFSDSNDYGDSSSNNNNVGIENGDNYILGIRVYELLSWLTLLCVGCCVYLSCKSTAFFADVILSCGILFKGTWILQAGLSLYTEMFSPKGCRVVTLLPDEKMNVQCDLVEDGLRGVALMNLLFIGHATVILIVCFLLFGVLSRKRAWRWGSASSLGEMESENLLMRSSPLEVELQ